MRVISIIFSQLDGLIKKSKKKMNDKKNPSMQVQTYSG